MSRCFLTQEMINSTVFNAPGQKHLVWLTAYGQSGKLTRNYLRAGSEWQKISYGSLTVSTTNKLEL